MKTRKKVLENEHRRTIYNFVKENPGLHMRELQRRLDIPLSTLEYHLDYLEKKEILSQEDDRRYCRYFAEDHTNEEKKLLSALRQKRLREIILLVLSEEMLCFKELSKEIMIADSTLSHYLGFLAENQILVKERIGAETCYRIKSEKTVVRSLLCYQSSFVDKLVDNVLATFLEFEFL
ncbi:winged helix-turn-helix transcriptional regulator [Thermoproteota archaeon]